jgi:hypothetical protein
VRVEGISARGRAGGVLLVLDDPSPTTVAKAPARFVAGMTDTEDSLILVGRSSWQDGAAGLLPTKLKPHASN